MNLLLTILLICSSGFAQTRLPPVSGQRIVVEISPDLQTWTMAMPYNTPRGFIRARVESCEAFKQWIDAADAAAGGELAIFSNGRRNPQCWGAAFDLTPICMGEKAGILISPCHVLFSTHWHPDTGAVLKWMTADNQIVSRTLTALASLADISTLYPDITIGRVDSDVPASITFAKVLNGTSLPDWQGYRVPVLIRDQFNDLHEVDVQRVTILAVQPTVYLEEPLATHRAGRFKTMIAGDSGSPVCLVQNGQLVLLSIITFADGRGAYLSAHLDAINAAMTQVGGGYQLTLCTP